MRVQNSLAILVVAFVALVGRSAAAEVLKFAFTGAVTSATAPLPLYGADPIVGDPVTGYFTYDTSVADITGDPNQGDYPQSIASGVTVFIDGQKFSVSNYTMRVLNDVGFDLLRVLADGGPASVNDVPTSDLQLDLQLLDGNQTAFNSDALPSSINLAEFTSFAGGQVADFIFDTNGAALIDFSIDSIRQVPEPSSIVIGSCAGFAGLALCWRRRRTA